LIAHILTQADRGAADSIGSIVTGETAYGP